MRWFLRRAVHLLGLFLIRTSRVVGPSAALTGGVALYAYYRLAGQWYQVLSLVTIWSMVYAMAAQLGVEFIGVLDRRLDLRLHELVDRPRLRR